MTNKNNQKSKERDIKELLAETKKRDKEQSKQLQGYLKKIGKIPQITPEEEKKLWGRKKIIETGGDKILEKKIFNAYRKLTVSVADKLIEKSHFRKIFTRLELILLAERILQEVIKSYAWRRSKIKIDFPQFLANWI